MFLASINMPDYFKWSRIVLAYWRKFEIHILRFLQTIVNLYSIHIKNLNALVTFFQGCSTPLHGPLRSTIPELNCWLMN
jgi:hypothetical protein